MKSKSAILKIVVVAVLLACAFTLVACDEKGDSNPYDLPQFSTVGEMIDMIDSGEFAFKSATLTSTDYDEDGTLIDKAKMLYGQNMAYQEASVYLFGVVPSVSKTYVILDLQDNCAYTIMNNFLTNGWAFGKGEIEYEGFDGDNFAPLALKRYIIGNEIPLDTAVSISDGSVAFDTPTCKCKIYAFDATTVRLEQGLEDYKSRAESI